MNREMLMNVATNIVEADSRLRLAYRENDADTTELPDASHFIKLDGKRIGRDIELYGIMGDTFQGWEWTLAMFLEEVVLYLKKPCPQAYAVAQSELILLGKEVYSPEMQKEWISLF